jgi:protoporphyrinogen oxidase
VRIAIVGAGVTGLVAGRLLGQAGHQVTIFERWPGLGGQAATLDVGQGHLLERYYHHWFTSDVHILKLCEDLGLKDVVEWHDSKMAFFVDGMSRPFVTPLDLLRFTPLSLKDRLKMGFAVLKLQRSKKPISAYEHETAREWILREMGQQPYEKVWGPLLRGKFGSRAGDISMAWMWGKLVTRRKLEGKAATGEKLGYPSTSFEPLFTALVAEIEALGGTVNIDQPVRRIERDGESFTVHLGEPGSFRQGTDPRLFKEQPGAAQSFEHVLATVPSDIFDAMAGQELPAGYRKLLQETEYHTALCLLVEVTQPLSPFYWTNIADPSLPFVGLIEHTNMIPSSRYGGRQFFYVANYVEPGSELLDLDADGLLARYLPGLQKINPAFDLSWVKQVWRFSDHAGQPIVTVGYHERIPPFETGVPGLLLANTTQIYPEDRGTNYAVREGQQAAAAVLASISRVRPALRRTPRSGRA